MSFPIQNLNIYLIELHDLYELVQNMLMGLCKDKVDNDNVDIYLFYQYAKLCLVIWIRFNVNVFVLGYYSFILGFSLLRDIFSFFLFFFFFYFL